MSSLGDAPHHERSTLVKQYPPIVIVGVLFLALGVGNLIFGVQGELEFEKLLAQHTPQPAPKPLCLHCDDLQEEGSEGVKQIPAPSPEELYPSELKVRYDFYSFVASGGLILLGIGIVLTLAGLQSRRRNQVSRTEE